MALKYLERFPIEIYSKHIQWGLQNLQSYKICSKLTIKNTRTMPIMSFWYNVIVKLEHISHLFVPFTVNFAQLDAC